MHDTKAAHGERHFFDSGQNVADRHTRALAGLLVGAEGVQILWRVFLCGEDCVKDGAEEGRRTHIKADADRERNGVGACVRTGVQVHDVGQEPWQ